VAIALILAGSRIAGACAIDGVPSLMVDNTVVRINLAEPTSPATLSVWAPFVTPFSLSAGHSYAFTEIRQRIPLTPEAFKQPWRWTFGDGTPAVRGTTVRHEFRRPGVYKVTVSAYFPSHTLWYAFDALQVHVVPS